MSAADELLTSLSETVTEHSHTVVDMDSYFVINPATRAIKNTTGRPVILIEGDHNSEIFTFEIPRYIEGHDMKLCTAVKVHYNNIGESVDEETGETIVKENSGVADLTDLRVNPENADTVICSWTIKRKATRLDGMMDFLIQYLCAEPDGTVTYEWHTDFFTDVTVKPGRNNGDSEIEEYTDLLEQWRARLFGAGDSVVSNIEQATLSAQKTIQQESEAQQSTIEAKGRETLDTIPPDYTELYYMAEESIRTKACAVIVDVEGKYISVNDASSNSLQSLRIFGKTNQITTTGVQLVNLPDKEFSSAGINWICRGGVVTANGTTTGTSSTTNAIYHDLTGMIGTFFISGSGSNIEVCVSVSKDGSTKWYKNQSFELDGTETSAIIYCQVYGKNIAVNETVYPMINIGMEALPWEPYSGGYVSPSPEWKQDLDSIEKPEVRLNSLNLCNLPDMASTKISGVTWVYKNGMVTANGTTTAQSNVAPTTCPLDLLPGTYTVSGGDKGVLIIILRIRGEYKNYFTSKNGKSSTFDVNSGDILYLYAQVPNGNTVTNVTIYPMVNNGTVTLPWEPYKETQTIVSQYILQGIPVDSGGTYTDSNGQQWIADEIVYDYSNHAYKYVQNCFETTITDFSAAKVTAPVNGFTEGYLTCGVVTKPKSSALCDSFVYAGSGDKVRFAMANASIYFTLEGELTADEWRTRMTELSPTILVPRLEPIAHELTAEEVQAFKALHTNYSHTTFLNDSKAHMTVKYAADTKTYTDNLMILTDETTGTKYRLVVNNGTLSIVPLS